MTRPSENVTDTSIHKEDNPMKLIIAMIQPEKLPDVKEALFEAEVHKMTVTNALGCGQQMGYTETFRGSKTEINLLKKVRIDIAVNDDFVEKTIQAIVSGARSNDSGKIGDGKILVQPLEECVRIRSGERGSDAVG
jgi:nitrogen regulatory protein P-II 1